MGQLEDFSSILSPLSFFFCTGFLPLLVVLFRPSFFELFATLAIDFACLYFFQKIDQRVFPRLYPDSSAYFPEFQLESLTDLRAGQKKELVRSLFAFPLRRAAYCFWLSIPKVMPSALIVAFVWRHSDSGWTRFARFWGMELLIFSYFASAIFLESHELVSRKLREIHARYDWQEVFRSVEISRSFAPFGVMEIFCLGSIWVFMILCQVLLVSSHETPDGGRFYLGLKVALISLLGLAMMGRIWVLSQNFLRDGLESILSRFDHFEPGSPQRFLPLNSSPVLARCEQTYNSLTERLRVYEQEVSRWLLEKTDQSRYTAMGELTALVAHDLSAPLSVILFCAERFREDPELARNRRYIDKLSENAQRSLELVDSIKAFLNHSRSEAQCANFSEVQGHVRRLLESQYFSRDFARVRIEIEEGLLNARICMSPSDLIHVLFNLLSNSVENLLKNQIDAPVIRMAIDSRCGQTLTIRIEDNGTGLSRERFEQLTSYAYLAPPSVDPGAVGNRGRGLGLKLIRRLVERVGGKLEVVGTSPSSPRGTCFHLQLQEASR